MDVCLVIVQPRFYTSVILKALHTDYTKKAIKIKNMTWGCSQTMHSLLLLTTLLLHLVYLVYMTPSHCLITYICHCLVTTKGVTTAYLSFTSSKFKIYTFLKKYILEWLLINRTCVCPFMSLKGFLSRKHSVADVTANPTG